MVDGWTGDVDGGLAAKESVGCGTSGDGPECGVGTAADGSASESMDGVVV